MPSTCSRRWYVPGGPHSPQSPTPRDQDRRRHALHTLCTLLTSPEGALHAQPRVASFWVPLLQLLYAAEQWINDGATSDPRPAFKAFSKSVDQVEASRAKAKKRADEIKSKGSAYFKQWEKQLAEIANPEISKMAEARKAKLGETFGKVSPLLEEAKADFDPFLSDLKDLRIALGNDLTANGVIAAKDIIKKTNKTGAEVQTSLNALIAEMDSIAAMLTTAKVAPATKK
jgi:hypothetical protein